jgi:cobalt-zinc-cadmium efflux system protein
VTHDHQHGHGALRAGARHKGRLALACAILTVFMVVEVVTALLTHSLALLADAGHMVTDVLGMGMALAAIQIADRTGPHRHRTFGLYRLEILAALANAVLLFGVGVYVVVEAIRRVSHPADVLATPLLIVATLGLVANVVVFAMLRQGAKESLNVQGAYLEVWADTIGSVGVIVGAVLLQVTGWRWVDPVIGVAIGAFVLPRTWRLAAAAVRILVQAAPPGTDLGTMEADLRKVVGVVDVHDLHVWTLTSDMEVVSAHLMVVDGTDSHAVLDQARHLMRSDYRIEHATFQIEPESHEGCHEIAW